MVWLHDHDVKIEGSLKRGSEPDVAYLKRQWHRKRSFWVAAIVAVCMFFVGYSGLILLFEEALFIAIPSFFAAYFGLELLNDEFVGRK